MVDHGISENYVIWWMDNFDHEATHRYDRAMNYACAFRRSGIDQSLSGLYEGARHRFNGNVVLAAEALRRALAELAEPSPVDDSLPLPDSPVWQQLPWVLGFRTYGSIHVERAPRYRPRVTRSRYFE